MKKLNAVLLLGVLAFGGVFLQAENLQHYNLEKIKCEKFIAQSRKEVENGNLSLARVYAKKALQANPWDKLAWANYDDIIQKIADEGEIEDYGTAVEESQQGSAPAPSDGDSQFEGC